MLFSATALASAKDDYNDGVEFFKKGDYHSAIASFKSAEKKGMESAALYYNLGSAYFKTEQYDASKKYFTRVRQYPDQRALAEFNLGMIAMEQNNNEEALAHFKYAQANSKDKKIVDASKQTIAELTGTPKRWGAFVLGNIGYDDNISVTPDNLALGSRIMALGKNLSKQQRRVSTYRNQNQKKKKKKKEKKKKKKKNLTIQK